MQRRLWSKTELILALNLYLKMPFSKINHSNADVIKLAYLLNRTANSVAMRLANYAACDPYHQARGVGGLKNGMSVCLPIWNEYMADKEGFILNSEILLAKAENLSIENKYRDVFAESKDKVGTDKERLIKTRVNQDVFRTLVLANYDSKCAISGIDIEPLLVASHIIPWSQNEAERLNPENGICLSALFDRAFDKGFIGINGNYNIIISTELKKYTTSSYYDKYFGHLSGIKLRQPVEYYPSKDFLQYHLDTVFKG